MFCEVWDASEGLHDRVVPEILFAFFWNKIFRFPSLDVRGSLTIEGHTIAAVGSLVPFSKAASIIEGIKKEAVCHLLFKVVFLFRNDCFPITVGGGT